MAIFEPVPAFADNYVWLITDPPSLEAVVVDPGEASPMLQILEKRGLELAAILLTHHHGDHIGGVADIICAHPAPVYGPAREKISTVEHPLVDGDLVPLTAFGFDLEVIEVPGHTAGHIAYLGPDFALVGDTLFAGGCGRIFEGTPEQMLTSLKRLAALPGETLVYCAHEYTVANLRFAREVEPSNQALEARLVNALRRREEGLPTVPSTISEELETNPFLRCDQPSVASAAEEWSGLEVPTEVDVFTAVRSWKDGWRG
jgi:hydroxyacylglutathione hydrolase